MFNEQIYILYGYWPTGYQKPHWGGGKVALGFGPGRIKTLFSMATDSVHRLTMGIHKKSSSPKPKGPERS